MSGLNLTKPGEVTVVSVKHMHDKNYYERFLTRFSKQAGVLCRVIYNMYNYNAF